MKKNMYWLTWDGAKIRWNSTVDNGGKVPRLGSIWKGDASLTILSISMGWVCLAKSSRLYNTGSSNAHTKGNSTFLFNKKQK